MIPRFRGHSGGCWGVEVPMPDAGSPPPASEPQGRAGGHQCDVAVRDGGEVLEPPGRTFGRVSGSCRTQSPSRLHGPDQTGGVSLGCEHSTGNTTVPTRCPRGPRRSPAPLSTPQMSQVSRNGAEDEGAGVAEDGERVFRNVLPPRMQRAQALGSGSQYKTRPGAAQ